MDNTIQLKKEHLFDKAFLGSSLFSKIRYYVRLSQWAQAYFSKYPNDWHKYQTDFNLTLNKIYEDILQFERNNINRFESKVNKIKERFQKKYRHYFLFGDFIKFSLQKPFGYAGDFKIIDDIYMNNPRTTGFDRLWDNYFQQLAISKAVRERKEDFKEIIIDFVKKHKEKQLRILSLASGSAREIKELLEPDSDKIFTKVTFDCIDSEERANNYARQLLKDHSSVNFFKKNSIRIALKKDLTKEFPHKYDLIYSTGLFDYFGEKANIKLVGNLKKIMNKNSLMVISNVRDKFSNTSSAWMEWVAEWYLIYRSEEEFRKIFLSANISTRNFKIIVQRSKVMQYCFATID